MTKSKPLASFLKYYQEFNLDNRALFDEVYSQNVVFIDPFHKIQGNQELFKYFQKLMSNVSNCRFSITGVMEADTPATAVIWEMFYSHKNLNRGREIKVNGVTHLQFNGQVTFHRDYFDSGQMLHRHLPVLGSLIRLVERRI